MLTRLDVLWCSVLPFSSGMKLTEAKEMLTARTQTKMLVVVKRYYRKLTIEEDQFMLLPSIAPLAAVLRMYSHT